MNQLLIKKEGEGEFSLHFNGIKIGFSDGSEIMNLHSDKLKLIEHLKFSNIPEDIYELDIIPNVSQKNRISPFIIDMFYIGKKDSLFSNITILLIPDIDNWKKSISPKEFVSYFFRAVEKLSGYSVEKEFDLGIEGVAYCLVLKKEINHHFTIGENLEHLFKNIEKIITNSKINHKQFSLNTLFTFPKEYKSACEQYLLYFTTFLKDLGIEAKTDLENQENGVLFKIFPKDKEEALTQIKEALEVYLALPVQQNIEEAVTQFPDAAVQQLISNVYHLKSQLVLANSTILKLQRKNETLELFQYQNKQIIHLEEKKNEEKLFGGILTVKEYDGKGFNIDLPKLFRMLKRVWKK